ncbi:hypothetical protein C7999DRAFT_38801 [Corynascus novoguineensis]|uniref:Pentatricopeptide repeat domain-containing protein n=1 Tax=Corynascus novoguineensis TaxID=1126955 RepID=A0AAN7CZD1_9PEZI|nr:hypothetical protein C7999DRAFT_38801 [Corynascus novoguineensis]
MLGLWSMAAQLRACHCRACLRATRAAARRVTTSTTGAAGNPRRRKILASDVFTACYSAIMATAAVIDAGRKDRRRRELDTKIAEAKSSLACLLEESAGRDLAKLIESPYHTVPFSRPLEKADIVNDICKLDADFLRDLQQKRRDRLSTAQHIRTMLGLSWNPELPEARKATLAKCEEAIVAEKERNFDRREPQTETQMEKITAMVTDLVDRLMAEAWWISEVEAPGSHPALNSPDSASTMIRMLRSDGYPSYNHPDLDPWATTEQRERLNEVNVNILSDWAPPLRERYVAKICYNFLVCNVPPGIQNYNMLILGFSFLGEYNLSQAVVDSFLYLSHLKPSEATYLCLLHHYRLKGDIVGFQGVIKRMFGYDPRGIGLMRRTANYVQRCPELQAWAATQDVALVSGHYVQRAPLTQNVAEAIMEGLIDFGMLREGARLLAVCLQEQWTISKDLLWRLFHSCLTLLDTAAVKIVIRGLLDNIDQASLLLLGPNSVSPGPVRQLRHLLNIWQATALPGNENIPNHELQAGGLAAEFENTKLDHLATAVWIREMLHHTSMMGWWLRRAEKKLLDRSVPLLERLDMVMSVLNFADERPALEMEKSEHMQRVAKMDWLLAQTVSMDFHIRNAENIICKALAKQMPRQLQTRSHFKSAVPLEQRINRALLYTTPGTVEYDVATLFDMSNELDSQIKKSLIKALPKTYAQGLRQTQNDSGDVSFGRIVAYFKHYLAGVQERQEKEAEMASKPDPFVRLFEALPKPISFWKRRAAATASAAAGTAPSPGHIGW